VAKDSKKGFVLYYDYRQHLDLLNENERGRLLAALLDYGEMGREPDLDGAVLMAFSFIRAQMDRDAQKYAEICRKRSEEGRRGGRPPEANANNQKQAEAKEANAFLGNQSVAKKPDTETDTETGTDTETDTETGTDTDILPAPPPETTPHAEIVALYHEICTSFPRLRSVGDKRKKAITARWKEYGHSIDAFRELFTLAEASDFLKGKNVKDWRADFDWLLCSSNMAKVLEGKYNDRPKGGEQDGEHQGPAGSWPAGGANNGKDDAAPLSGFHMAAT